MEGGKGGNFEDARKRLRKVLMMNRSLRVLRSLSHQNAAELTLTPGRNAWRTLLQDSSQLLHIGEKGQNIKKQQEIRG